MGTPPLRALRSGTVIRRVLTGLSNTQTPKWLRRLCAVPVLARGPGCGIGRRRPARREAIPASPYTNPKIRLRKEFYAPPPAPPPHPGGRAGRPAADNVEKPLCLYGKWTFYAMVVENSGDNSRKAGIVKPLKWNTKFAIEAADDGTPDIKTGDGNGVPVNAPAWGGIMATTEAAHLRDLWQRRTCPYCGNPVREGARVVSGDSREGGFCSIRCHSAYYAFELAARADWSVKETPRHA